MSKDSSHTHLHLHLSSHSTYLEEYTRGGPLAPDEIYLPPEHQPLNPEDEEDVVPAMHAAFGITRAAMMRKGKGEGDVWKDLGLERLLEGDLKKAGAGGFGVGGGIGGGLGRVGGNGGVGGARIVGDGEGLLEGFRREGQAGGAVGRTLQTRRRAEGTTGARLRG
ncbi:Anaphase-promoting complex subunit 13 [Venturia nashicola]|uniref:Anaphase-promoting complex subunit 13 n=1 Tax=Venturia nashicola TaxID=86259 RepID=A0A4Z1NWH8_9PEZI|nr:Anaphase-promoting complex subunit 13 [Venturia nashicola]TLD29659.1 Anaphase-promoting complex subunit 13 [Venturia nashicola]